MKVVKEVLPTLAVISEADWPSIVSLCLFLENGLGSSFCDGLLESWVRSIMIMNKDQEDEDSGMPLRVRAANHRRCMDSTLCRIMPLTLLRREHLNVIEPH